MTNKIDMVNSPPHYQVAEGLEVIDVRAALLNNIAPMYAEYVAIDHWSRSWEYLTRMWQKNGLEDAKKAQFYLNRLIKQLEDNEIHNNSE